MLRLVFWCIALLSVGNAAENPKRAGDNQSYTAAYGKTGEQPRVDASELPRIPFTSREQALETFVVKKGFRLEMAAAEPLVADPIAIAFDENNRMFVVDMIDYSERRGEQPHLGRIQMLEDLDADGQYDRATTYADNLPWPTAVICYAGGIYVAASPDILYLKDKDGDGQADLRTVVYTGFGAGREKLNVQALLNSFNWGLDHRIHGATGPNGGSISNLVLRGQNVVSCNGQDFSFDPRTMDFRAEAGGGQYGLSFDSRGRKYVCSNSDHLQAMIFDPREVVANRFFSLPSPRVSIAADGPAAEVYRLSPDEPWRIVRTRWRVTGVVPGLVEGGGRVSGYFTGATGGTIYRGDAFGEEFVDNAFIGDAGGNLVHRKIVMPDGVGLIARRPEDEQRSEFIASKDIWFRPVQFGNGPDGCFYICDMYREVIEHPWSLPENIKKHLDLDSGNDRGRIYRIVPEGYRRREPSRLGRLGTAELVAMLGHPNGWHRDTAARLLFERQDPSAVAALEIFGSKSSSSLGRMHALYALDGQGALKWESIELAARDRDALVREHAAKLAGLKLSVELADATRGSSVLLALARDSDIQVRFRTALALGRWRGEGQVEALADILRMNPTDRWIQSAALHSIGNRGKRFFDLLSSDLALLSDPVSVSALAESLRIAGQVNDPKELESLFDRFSRPIAGWPMAMLVGALGEGLLRAGSSLDKADQAGVLGRLFEQATQTASDVSAQPSMRIQAVQLLGTRPFGKVGLLLASLLEPPHAEEVRLASLQVFARYTNSSVPGELLTRWGQFSTRLKAEAVRALLTRAERIEALLGAVESGLVRASDLTSTQIEGLLRHPSESVRKRVAPVFSKAQLGPRAEELGKWQAALAKPGQAARGEAIYLERCASCHKSGTKGFAVGPDFATLRNAGPEKLLIHIIDPNREVAPQYVSTQVETKDGETISGIVIHESASVVMLRQAFGTEAVVPRPGILRITPQGRSMMPEGLESGLSIEAMSDLLAFIQQ